MSAEPGYRKGFLRCSGWEAKKEENEVHLLQAKDATEAAIQKVGTGSYCFFSIQSIPTGTLTGLVDTPLPIALLRKQPGKNVGIISYSPI